VPIVMGPYYQNFRAIVDDLRAHDAIRIAQPENFSEVLVDLLTDREAALNLGQRARQVFAEQAGATERCVAALTALLSSQQTAERAL
jgi:3-deoxy-D-manno-octulosonic-acid transferase